MAIKEILLLGNESLYQVSTGVSKDRLPEAQLVINDLHDTLMHFRRKYGFGRAIAAPQIGAFSRIIYMHVNNTPMAFINPEIQWIDDKQFEVWDDCMSFPGLEVRLLRYKKCRLRFKNTEWQDCSMDFEGDLSELIQHEYDHLNGILAVQRAIDNRSYRINKSKTQCF